MTADKLILGYSPGEGEFYIAQLIGGNPHHVNIFNPRFKHNYPKPAVVISEFDRDDPSIKISEVKIHATCYKEAKIQAYEIALKQAKVYEQMFGYDLEDITGTDGKLADNSAIAYDGGSYRAGCYLVRNAKADIEQLPPEIQSNVNSIVKMAVIGTAQAYKEIYEPNTDPDTIQTAGSPGDFETDKAGLGDLEKIFDQ